MMRGLLLAALVLGGLTGAAGLADLPADSRGFARWTLVADKGLPTGGPHAGPSKVVFANEPAARVWAGKAALPDGSLVVKTTGPLAAPTLVAIMRKTRAGWFYEEYLPAGSGYRLAFGGPGRQAQCSACHAGAKARDYLFTRP